MPKESNQLKMKGDRTGELDLKPSRPTASSSKHANRKHLSDTSDSSDDEVRRKVMKKKKLKVTARHTASLEELQASSPPPNSSYTNKNTNKQSEKNGSRVSQAPHPSGSSKIKKPQARAGGVFGGTINKISKPQPKPAYGPFSGTINKFPSNPRLQPQPQGIPIKRSAHLPPGPKSKVNPSRPDGNGKRKIGGLEAVKDTLRKPKVPVVEKSAAQIQWERDNGPDALVLKKSEKEEKAIELFNEEANRFFEEAKNCPKPVEIERPPVLVVKDKQTEALQEIVAGIEDEMGDEALTPEEQEYLKNYSDPNNTCPFCDHPLPINMELKPRMYKQLLRYRTRIRDIGLEAIGWDRQIDFCNAHKYHTTTIPLGHRAGYPKSIAWMDLWKKLEVSWIRDRIATMVELPTTSPMFRYYFSAEEEKEGGEPEWSRFYISATPADHLSAGYYGDLGTNLIRQYITDLVDWGYLPPLDHSSRYHPLGSQDFVSRVLIPEIAVMLIQSDRGLQPEGDMIFEDEGYTQAQEIRKKSTVYGKVAYYDMDSTLPDEIMPEFSLASKFRKEELEVLRGQGEGKKKGKATIVDLTVEEEDADDSRAGPSSPVMPVRLQSEVELDDSDFETGDPTEEAFKSSSSVANSQITEVEVSPRARDGSLTPVPLSNQRETPRIASRRDSSIAEDEIPCSSQSMLSSASSSPRKRCRKKRKAEAEAEQNERDRHSASISVCTSQESFGEFDFTSQDLGRLDAVVAAQ